MKNLLNLWKKLKKKLKRFLERTENQSSEKGVFHYDYEQKKWIKVRDRSVEGKYAMPLETYLERKHHTVKGSWHRQPDPRHTREDALKDDFGKAGCKGGYGMFHPKRNGRCVYCGLNDNQIKKNWEKKNG